MISRNVDVGRTVAASLQAPTFPAWAFGVGRGRRFLDYLNTVTQALEIALAQDADFQRPWPLPRSIPRASPCSAMPHLTQDDVNAGGARPAGRFPSRARIRGAPSAALRGLTFALRRP